MFQVRDNRPFPSFQRYGQILKILARYGFGDLIDRLRDKCKTTWAERLIRRDNQLALSTPERVRMAFEELGPTFIKLGQILSVRPDLLPPDFIQEFTKFQDSVPSFPSADAKSIVESQLGKTIPELFSWFGEQPIAAASLAQVHPATTLNGDEVIIKIRRPGINRIIETDIKILYHLARLAERRIPEVRTYEPMRIVGEFARTILKELDFVREGRNVDRFGRYFAEDETVYIPKIYWDLSAKEVLTMERIHGIKITNVEDLEAAGLNRKTIAKNGANLILEEIFEYHFFHADPHPGNIFVLEQNVIAPVDYGMVGSLTEEIVDQMANILTAVVDKDADLLTDALIAVAALSEPVDKAALQPELADFLERYYEVPLSNLDFSSLINELIDIVRRYSLRLPPELILMAKALIVNEGVGRTLYPEFNIVEHARPYARKILLRRIDPMKKLRKLIKVFGETESLVQKLPSDLQEILSKLRADRITFGFRHEGLEGLVSELDRSTNRLSFAIIIGSLIIGSSFVTQLGSGPFLWGFPLLGLIGYLVAAVLGLWLVLGIMRSGRL